MPEARESGDAKVRNHLIGAAVDFRELMSRTLQGHVIEGGETVWDHLSRKVDALLEDQEVAVSRNELPLWHPESTAYGGRPYDKFVLGRDDVLRRA